MTLGLVVQSAKRGACGTSGPGGVGGRHCDSLQTLWSTASTTVWSLVSTAREWRCLQRLQGLLGSSAAPTGPVARDLADDCVC